MSRKILILLLLPSCIFANESSINGLNDLVLYTELPTRLEPNKSIDYQLNEKSFVPDKLDRNEAYSIRPMKNWNKDTLTTENYPSAYNLRSTAVRGSVVIKVDAAQNNNENVAKWAADQQKAIIGCDVNNSNKNCKVYAIHGGFSSDKAPQKLNYAFIGKITLTIQPANKEMDITYTYTCNNVIFGQGFNGTQHNWWMYTNFWPTNMEGKPKKEAYSDRIMCYNPSGTAKEFEVSSSGTHAFSFKRH